MDSPIFRLYVLGQVRAKGSTSLTLLAEHAAGCAIQRRELTESKLADLRERVGQLRSFAEGGGPVFDRATLRQLGEEFRSLLFANNIQRLFDSNTPGPQAAQPVLIHVEDPLLAGWPWEYLYDREQATFLGRSSISICRGVFAIRRAFESCSAPPRILVLRASPPSDRLVSCEEEVAWIRDRLAGSGTELEVQRVPRAADLQKILNEQEASIIHFIGHGSYDAGNGSGRLHFTDDIGNRTSVPADLFAEMVPAKTRLVFLNACQTGRASESLKPVESSIAAALLGRGVPAVIGAQLSIPDATAYVFSAEVYRSLREGTSLAKAVRNGRLAISLEGGDVDWGIPVLYATDPNAVLFHSLSAREAPIRVDSVSLSGAFEHAAHQASPSWPTDTVLATARPNVCVRFTAGTTPTVDEPGDPGDTPPMAEPAQRVGLFDIDARAGFLSEILSAANDAQSYYHFLALSLPVPAGTLRTDLGDTPQLYVPNLEGVLKAALGRFDLDFLIGLTTYPVAGHDAQGDYYDYFAASVDDCTSCWVNSAYEVRDYAARAGRTFAQAMLYGVVSTLLVGDARWKLTCHEESVGCPLDFCDERSDLVLGLRDARFNHRQCRSQVKDRAQLEAIDRLLEIVRT